MARKSYSPSFSFRFVLRAATQSTRPHSLQPHGWPLTQLPMRPPAPHVTSHPASPSDGSALGSWASPATTPASHPQCSLRPSLYSCGSWGLFSMSPPSCPRPTVGLLLNGRALPASSPGSMSPPGSVWLLEGSTQGVTQRYNPNPLLLFHGNVPSWGRPSGSWVFVFFFNCTFVTILIHLFP